MRVPARANTKTRSGQAVCRNNLRQIGIAFMGYLGDPNDTYPGTASKSQYTTMPEDWIWWNTADPRIPGGKRDPANGPIFRYIRDSNTNVFHCPSDNVVTMREQDQIKDRKGVQRYLYSYSLNSVSIGGVNHGVASLYDIISTLHFKAPSIRNPARKIMVVEEKGASGLVASPDDGRWTPSTTPHVGDEITDIHNQKGTVLFTDGHVQLVRPAFGKDADHFDAIR